jgi:Ricin-type beta-trefoil lectin domain-like
VVTRNGQDNDTQRWVLTNMGGDLFTIVQVSSGRFLDAHEIPSLNFRVVTRPQQNNDTQLWRLEDFGGSFFTIQQLSSGRSLEATLSAAEDFQVVTRPRTPGSNLQIWRILGA